MKRLLALAACALSAALTPAISAQDNAVELSGAGYTAVFSRTNGALRFSEKGGTDAVFRSGEHGLWQLRLLGGATVDAAAFAPDSTERSFRYELDAAKRQLKMFYHSADLDVTITATAGDQQLDLQAHVSTRKDTVLEVALPARMRFDAEQVLRFVCPANGNQSVGTAFRSAFFKLQDEENPSGWQTKPAGPKGYQILYGGPLAYGKDKEPPAALRVTEQGKTVLGLEATQRLANAKATVNRPPKPNQADLVLVDSDQGPYFSASHLGGSGFLWRIGGGVHTEESPVVTRIVAATVARLAAKAPAGRTKVGLLALKQGPPSGNWAEVRISDWRERLTGAVHAAGGKVTLVDIASPREMLQAAAADDFLVILNPYGEAVPARANDSIETIVAAIRRYVQSGGNWFEVGGHPFHSLLVPARYYQQQNTYPPAFADFFHLESRAGRAAVYRVQPRTWEPWQGAKDPNAIFVPGRIGCGGDEQGAWCDRPFVIHLAPGRAWQSPAVRMVAGRAAADDLRAYARANAVTRRLDDKMSAEVLARFKNSVLVYLTGNCREKLAALDKLPAPTQVHFADYLLGGFDKQYPDHLPPHPTFGTPAEFRALFDRGHQLGHLLIPYTNPTWWCDGPKGPTFEQHGDAPLLKKLDGRLSHEQYSRNEGFTVCHWHPAVMAANRKTVEQFSRDYPCDILFQDQCGARGWYYDLNPANPTVWAHTEGLLSMIAEDCRRKPLSTESGWDGVVNFEAQLCGMSWAIVPTEGGPPWRRLMRTNYDPAAWEVFPVAQYIAHDKTAMIHHDLGQFVTNRETLAWTLGLGYALSYRLAAKAADHDGPRHWLLWLDRLQKSACARYVGQPLDEFAHRRGDSPAATDEGTMRARYGNLTVLANLDPQAKKSHDLHLPPFGFALTAPDLVAANLYLDKPTDEDDEGVSFVAQNDGRQTDIWVYARPGEQAAILAPSNLPGAARLTFDGQPPVQARVEGRVCRFTVPPLPDANRAVPPTALADKAPAQWPTKPAVAVLDMPGLMPTWTTIKVDQWVEALQQSRLVTQHQLSVKRIRTVDELTAALRAGPTACLAIINPYGERFPVAGPGQWQAMLDLVRHYVNHGGCWWETAGLSFNSPIWSDSGQWRGEHAQGMAYLNVPLLSGELDQAPEPLHAPSEGRVWLGDALAARLAGKTSAVNRGPSRSSIDPGHVTLLAGQNRDFIGGYRLDGWGWLWRIGGMNPNPDVVLPATVAALEHLYTHAPQPIKAGGLRRLWHAVLAGQ